MKLLLFIVGMALLAAITILTVSCYLEYKQLWEDKEDEE